MWVAIVAGLAGVVIGSLAAVLASGLVEHPRLGCRRCAYGFEVRDLMPVVRWLRWKGRCPHCAERIGVQYLSGEVAGGVLFAALGWRFGFDPVLPAYLYLAAVSVALAMIDIDRHLLPNVLTLPSYPIGIALLGLAATVTGDGLLRLFSALAGMAGLWLLYAVLFLIHPRGMGWGDVKLAGVCGLYLGWLGFGGWAAGTLLGFVLGAAYGVGLIVLRRATRKTPIPFGPFMIAGTLLAILLGGWLGDYLAV